MVTSTVDGRWPAAPSGLSDRGSDTQCWRTKLRAWVQAPNPPAHGSGPSTMSSGWRHTAVRPPMISALPCASETRRQWATAPITAAVHRSSPPALADRDGGSDAGPGLAASDRPPACAASGDWCRSGHRKGWLDRKLHGTCNRPPSTTSGSGPGPAIRAVS